MRTATFAVALLAVLVLACLSLTPAVIADDTPNWSVSAIGATGPIPVSLAASYAVYEDADWVGWLDVFFADSEDQLGGGVSAEYKRLPLPSRVAAGVGACWYDGKFRPVAYIKCGLLSW